MLSLKFSPLATKDLIEIKQYISNELCNQIAAQKVIQIILEKINLLKQFPLLGEALNNKINVQSEHRYLICNNYLTFYRIEANNIYIVRILYAKSDYLSKLFDLDIMEN